MKRARVSDADATRRARGESEARTKLGADATCADDEDLGGLEAAVGLSAEDSGSVGVPGRGHDEGERREDMGREDWRRPLPSRTRSHSTRLDASARPDGQSSVIPTTNHLRRLIQPACPSPPQTAPRRHPRQRRMRPIRATPRSRRPSSPISPRLTLSRPSTRWALALAFAGALPLFACQGRGV